ncbi:MAG: low affinity iron permease family protein [Hyphomicrobiaceae bacterium]|nr:low affinity iron permease family protein [Hyphomicrobiaceae bacterium]
MPWRFSDIAKSFSRAVGTPTALVLACVVVIAWAIAGPIFAFSDTWQLVINTGTTIVTFLMVFLIQNTQNRDSRAIHLKLDELICAVDHARLELVDAEELSDEELDRHQREFKRKRRDAATNGNPTGTRLERTSAGTGSGAARAECSKNGVNAAAP